MARYDRAITVFSPDGQLLQVQYAQEAVSKGSPVVGVKGKGLVVLAVEKRAVEKLEVNRTERKIVVLDEHVALAFAGLRADARVLITRAQIECQTYSLQMEEPISIELIAHFVARFKQLYTQNNGRRPFGISCLLGGFDSDGVPHLYQTEPSGMYYEWKATATGRFEKAIREFLEKNYCNKAVATEKETIKLTLRALMEAERKNLDVAVIKFRQPVKLLDSATINAYINEIEQEKEEKERKRR